MIEKVKAIGQSIRHRRLTFLLLVGVLAFGIIGGLYAIQSGAGFDGQTAAGDHNWWTGFKDTNQAFCENCHTAVATDITTGPHKETAKSDCSYCHSPGGADHAAAAAACTDCHESQGTDIASASEAHNGIQASLGETPTDSSKTCQSCHTHVEVDMTVVLAPPIPLQMGG